MSSRTKRRLAFAVFFAGLCALALVGVVWQALGRDSTNSRKELHRG